MQPQSGLPLTSPCRISGKFQVGESLRRWRGWPPRDDRRNRAPHAPCVPSRASAIRWPRGFADDALPRQRPQLWQGCSVHAELRERRPAMSIDRQLREAPSNSQRDVSSGNPRGPKFGSDGHDLTGELTGFESANSPRKANLAGAPGWAKARQCFSILSPVFAPQRMQCASVVKRLSVETRDGASKHGRELTPRCALSRLAHGLIDQLSRSRDFQQEKWEGRP
jgi:hypothetical protein